MTPHIRRYSLNRIIRVKEAREEINWAKLSTSTGSSINTLKRYVAIYDDEPITSTTLKTMSDNDVRHYVTTGTWVRPDRTPPDIDSILDKVENENESIIDCIEAYQRDAENPLAPSTCYRKVQKARELQKLSIVLQHEPGEAIQVDFAGDTIVLDNRKSQKVYFFVAILPCSQYTFVYPTPDLTALSFVEAHVAAFEYFGGVSNTVIPDNTKAAVIKAGREPVLNVLYQEMAMEYDVNINPARPRKPKDKALVENAVGIANRWIIKKLRKQAFKNIHEVRKAVEPLVEHYNSKPFTNKPGCRESAFLEKEKMHLKPLPNPLPQLGAYCATSQIKENGHILVRGHYYSVPFQFRNKIGVVKINSTSVLIYVNGCQVAVHTISNEQGGYTTEHAHKHPRQKATDGFSQEYALSAAAKIGKSVLHVIESLFAKASPTNHRAQRAAYSILKLAKKHGEDGLELACQYQIEQGFTAYTHINNCLKRKTYLSHHYVNQRASFPHSNTIEVRNET